MVLARLGYRPTIDRVTRGFGAYPNAAPAWTVTWHPGAVHHRIRRVGGLNLYPVKSVVYLPHEGDVFNFDVADTRDYVADGYVVHNCMEGRGRFRRAGDKEKCGVIQNSWGGYLSIPSQDDKFIDVWTPTGDIRVELPEGCFATTLDVIDRMLGEQDSFFFAGLKGWEALRLDYTP
jgi:hypothetical protein